MNEDILPKMTDFDRIVSTEPIQIMKAMIPYAPPSGQRILSLYAKALELRNTLTAFQRGGPDLSACSTPESAESSDPMALLAGIRDYCSPLTRRKMDECINMLAVLQMAELLQEADDGKGDD